MLLQWLSQPLPMQLHLRHRLLRKRLHRRRLVSPRHQPLLMQQCMPSRVMGRHPLDCSPMVWYPTLTELLLPTPFGTILSLGQTLRTFRHRCEAAVKVVVLSCTADGIIPAL